MSTMLKTTKSRRPRRQFDEEFKAGAVRLVLDDGQTVGRVARELDLTESALRTWVDRARADRTNGRTGLTTEEREELRRLREGDSRAAYGAGDPKKRGRLLREGERVRFAFHPHGEGALHGASALSGARRVAERVLRVVPAARVGTRTAGPAAPRVDPRVA